MANMTDQEKHDHDVKTAGYGQRLEGMTDEGVIMSALGILILRGRESKYDLPPQDAAVVYACLHRANPTFVW